MRVDLSWPPKELSPNARVHWAKKGLATKKYRQEAMIFAKSAARYDYSSLPESGPIKLRVTFFTPDNRRRDIDNMAASMKAAFDGIAEAWGVDDSRFRLTLEIGAPVKHGAVIVEVLQ